MQHDREFEKQVQQKMQELRFAPGSDVWARVQADIQRKKRRRPVVLWLLLAGLLVGGSWIAYTSMNQNGEPVSQAKIQPAAETVENNTPEVADANNNSRPAPAAAGTNKSIQQPAEQKNAVPVSEEKNIAANSKISSPTKTIAAAPAKRNPIDPNLVAAVKPAAANNNTVPNTQKNQKATKEKPATSKEATSREVAIIEKPNKDETSKEEASTEKPISPEPAQQEANKEVALTEVLNNKIPYTPAPAVQAPVQAPVQASTEIPDSVAMKNKSAGKTPGKSQWQWGIGAGAGASDLGKQLFRTTTVADFAFSNGTPQSGNVNRRPSDISAGSAFHAGAYVSKSIGKKFAAKLGLNYEYYSNSIRVGTPVSAPRVVNQGTDMKMVEEYFTTGTTTKYTNKYHFISLPVSIQWKLYDRAKHGIVWENGVNIARLLNTNALHFDGISGSYYKDNELFKNTQVMVSSSLLFTLKSKRGVQLYAGPHVQYSLSNLVDKNAGTEKHLRYAGLKLVTGFNKK